MYCYEFLRIFENCMNKFAYFFYSQLIFRDHLHKVSKNMSPFLIKLLYRRLKSPHFYGTFTFCVPLCLNLPNFYAAFPFCGSICLIFKLNLLFAYIFLVSICLIFFPSLTFCMHNFCLNLPPYLYFVFHSSTTFTSTRFTR